MSLLSGSGMTIRVRYLTLKRFARRAVSCGGRAGRSVSGAPRAVWARQLQPESVESNLASALRT
jgi:hypothetical protein